MWATPYHLTYIYSKYATFLYALPDYEHLRVFTLYFKMPLAHGGTQKVFSG